VNALWVAAGIEVIIIGVVAVALAAADALEDFLGAVLAFNVIAGAVALGAWLITRGVS
jgi:hypothetical protein